MGPIIQLPSDQITFTAARAILRALLKGQREKFRENKQGRDVKACPSGGNGVKQMK